MLFVQLDVGMSFLAPEAELSSGFVCLDFLRKVLRKNWPNVFSVCKPLRRHPSSTAVGKEARPFEMRHLMVILLLLAKHKTPPPLPPVSFCAIANIATVLAGRGSYFVYV